MFKSSKIKLVAKSKHINGARDIRAVRDYLSSMKTLMCSKYEYQLLLDMNDSIRLLSERIESDMFGKPDQLLMSPAQFESISKILRRDGQSD